MLALVSVVVAGFALKVGGGSTPRASADTTSVRRGGFDITIPVSGELAALKEAKTPG